MTAYVHPTAVVGDNFKPAPFTVIDDDVRIGDNVITGPGVHIRHGAVIGDNVLIGDHVTIHDEAHIGSNSVIADGAVIGRQPMEMPGEPRRTERLPGARIGERCQIGANAVVMAGVTLEDGAVVGEGAVVRLGRRTDHTTGRLAKERSLGLLDKTRQLIRSASTFFNTRTSFDGCIDRASARAARRRDRSVARTCSWPRIRAFKTRAVSTVSNTARSRRTAATASWPRSSGASGKVTGTSSSSGWETASRTTPRCL